MHSNAAFFSQNCPENITGTGKVSRSLEYARVKNTTSNNLKNAELAYGCMEGYWKGSNNLLLHKKILYFMAKNT